MFKINEINQKLEPVEKFDQVPFSQELWRKAFHLVSLSIPTIYIFVPKPTAIVILLVITSIAVVIDILIKKENVVQKIIFKIFGKIFRKYEKSRFVFNGATWMLISATINVLIFPKLFTIVSFYVLVFSDASAALFGKRFGHTRFLNKTLEGSLAFFLSAFIVILLCTFAFNGSIVFLLSGIAAILLATFVEASSAFLRVDDNLGIPLAISFILWLGWLFSQSIGVHFANFL